jgi:hypothetical protein
MASLVQPATTILPTESTTEQPTTTTAPPTPILHVPSPECPSVDALFQQLMELGGLTWSKRNITTVIIAAGTHHIDHVAQDADEATFTGVYLKGPHYQHLIIRGETTDKTILSGGLILCTGPDVHHLVFEDLFITNGDQAGWRSWMGNGLYVDDGAHDVRCTRCTFYDCEKLGVFVGDVKSHVVLSDCVMHGNKRGGAMASEGGAIDVLGEYTQGTCVVVGNVVGGAAAAIVCDRFQCQTKCCRVVVLSLQEPCLVVCWGVAVARLSKTDSLFIYVFPIVVQCTTMVNTGCFPTWHLRCCGCRLILKTKTPGRTRSGWTGIKRENTIARGAGNCNA